MLLGDYTQLRGLARDHDLSDELDRAIVVPWERMPRDVVTMHSRCIYIDENVGVQREIRTGPYPDEADPAEGKISVLAPIGSALLGLAASNRSTGNCPASGSIGSGWCARSPQQARRGNRYSGRQPMKPSLTGRPDAT